MLEKQDFQQKQEFFDFVPNDGNGDGISGSLWSWNPTMLDDANKPQALETGMSWQSADVLIASCSLTDAARVRRLFQVSVVAAVFLAAVIPAALLAQRRQVFAVRGSQPTLILPAPPRQLRRNLERAKRFVAEGQYTEAVELLDAILSEPDSEDYFIKNHRVAAAKSGEDKIEDAAPGGLGERIGGLFQPASPLRNTIERYLGTTRTTLKTEACRVLGTLPRQGREFYELQVGKTARRSLDQAIASRDIETVDEISRRYFHTQAGYEATLLLARYALDNNLPTTAAIHLTRLRSASSSQTV